MWSGAPKPRGLSAVGTETARQESGRTRGTAQTCRLGAMTRLRAAPVISATLVLLCVGFASSPKPLRSFTIDLRPLEFVTTDALSPARRMPKVITKPLEPGWWAPTIGYIGYLADGRLIVDWTSFAPKPKLTGTDATGTPFRLRALIIAPTTGAVLARFEWPATSARARVSPGPGGGFAAILPGRILLYSREFKETGEIPFPFERSDEHFWDAVRSKNGRFLLVSPNAGGPWTLFDLAARHALSTLPVVQGPYRNYAIAPFDNGSVLGSSGPRLEWQQPGGEWALVPFESGRCRASAYGSDLSTVFDGEFLAGGQAAGGSVRGCAEIALTSGKILFERDFSDGDSLGPVAVAPSSGRVALAQNQDGRKFRMLDLGGHLGLRDVVVLDGPDFSHPCILSAKALGVSLALAMAVSPDGQQLAIVDDKSTLRVFQLGPQGTKPTATCSTIR